MPLTCCSRQFENRMNYLTSATQRICVRKIIKYPSGIPCKIRSRSRGFTAKIIPVSVITAGFYFSPFTFPRKPAGMYPLPHPCKTLLHSSLCLYFIWGSWGTWKNCVPVLCVPLHSNHCSISKLLRVHWQTRLTAGNSVGDCFVCMCTALLQ